MLKHLQKLLLFFLLCGTAISQTTYEVIDLGTLGGNSSAAHGINDSSQVVGLAQTSNNVNRAFLWDDGTMTDLGISTQPLANKINNLTQIVGRYYNNSGYVRGFLWDTGVVIDLGDLGGNNTEARSINDLTQIVGYTTASGNSGRAFLWQNGTMIDLGTLSGESAASSINNLTQVVGTSNNGVGSTLAFLWENGQMTDLGTLGGTNAAANGINDLSQIVGSSTIPNGRLHAFLWENGTMQDLGTLTGVNSFAFAINDSSQIAGGFQLLSGEGRACIWYNGTASDLNTLIPPNTGWTLELARDINNKGEIVGSGKLNGLNRAFLLRPNTITITSPVAGEKWIAGETDTIKWTGGETNQLIDIKYSTDNGNTYSMVQLGVLAETGKYAWSIPNTILSTKVKIRLQGVTDTLKIATSDSFKIKPYIITRIDSSTGDYVAYNINTDRWGFQNIDADVWPQSWFQQFNYQGIDTFTNQQYPQQGFIAFKVAPDSIHPDWVSWVNTFGVSACYLNVSAPVYSLSAILKWQYANMVWNGSCFGIAISNALAFQMKNNFLTRYPNFPNFTNPINVTSNTNVIPVINELFTHQHGNPHRMYRTNIGLNKTPNQTLADLKTMLREDSVHIRTLSLLNNNGSGGHAILGYKLVQDNASPNKYRVSVYDNSYSDSLNAFVEIDTVLNTWKTYYGWTSWGGGKWLYLRDPAENYLSNDVFPKINDNQSPFILEDNTLQVFLDNAESILITNQLGKSLGYFNNTLITDIPNAFPFIVDNGSEGPPSGYELLNNWYSIQLNNFIADTFGVALFNSNKSFVYERNDAIQAQTDRLFFDGGVSAVNPDAQTKTINLTNLINETTHEKLFAVSSLELVQNDSVKIENPDSNKLNLISFGSAKDYNIELNYVTGNGVGKFVASDIQLTANTTHTFVPDWIDLTNSQLDVLVDVGNDGTIDDTLHLNNTVGVKDEGNLLSPKEYQLAQNYPNPFNPNTTIRYSIPQRSNVVLKVYDVLGNEVATLVNEEKDRGVHTINFDATQLASGIYFYRLHAGSFVETKKMILLR